MESVYLYFTAIIAAVALASLSLCDEQQTRGFRFALGVILTAALFNPAVLAIKGLANLDFTYTGEDFESVSLEKTLEQAFCDGIANGIAEEFSIKKENVSVVPRGFDREKMSAEEIVVTLYGTAAAKDTLAVERFVTELGVGKCVLEVQGRGG